MATAGMYKKNDLITITIEDIGNEGEGIGHLEGYTFFVKDAVIGDTVEARVTKPAKSYAYARMEKVIMPSPFRVSPVCEYHRQCGGCQIQAVSYAKQLKLMENKVRNNLIRIGKFDEAKLEWIMDPIVGMEEPYRYRNKAQYPIGCDKEGNPIAGFYAGRTHSIIANTECFLGAEENKEILDAILSYMREEKIPAYREESGEGMIRHVLIRKGFTSGEIMVCIVINQKVKENLDAVRILERERKSFEIESENVLSIRSTARRSGETKGLPRQQVWMTSAQFLPGQEKLLKKLSQIQGMTSISVNLNPENTNVIMGKDTYCIWGQASITDTIHVLDMSKEGYPATGEELRFSISPQSFYQVNPVQTEKLYSLALQYAGLTGKETVWDLYCGIGTISLFLAGRAGRVCGVEIVPQAIEDAGANAKRNNIQNATFFVGKAEEVLPAFYTKTSTDNAFAHPDVIVVDPPRKGCDSACLDTMLKMAPERIVYVSCDSATLARDLRILCDGGYELKKVRPVDMFPHTVHVENVCLMTRK